MCKLRLYAKVEENAPPEEKERIERERITAQSFLLMTFDRILKLLHPFIPYITEELYLTSSHRSKGQHLLGGVPSIQSSRGLSAGKGKD
jgi:valyl-tRNA synthetase